MSKQIRTEGKRIFQRQEAYYIIENNLKKLLNNLKDEELKKIGRDVRGIRKNKEKGKKGNFIYQESGKIISYLDNELEEREQRDFFKNSDFKKIGLEKTTAFEIYSGVWGYVYERVQNVFGFEELENKTEKIFRESLIVEKIGATKIDKNLTIRGITEDEDKVMKKIVRENFQNSLNNLSKEEILKIQNEIKDKQENLSKLLEKKKIDGEKYCDNSLYYLRFSEILEQEIKKRELKKSKEYVGKESFQYPFSDVYNKMREVFGSVNIRLSSNVGKIFTKNLIIEEMDRCLSRGENESKNEIYLKIKNVVEKTIQNLLKGLDEVDRKEIKQEIKDEQRKLTRLSEEGRIDEERHLKITNQFSKVSEILEKGL